jgi:hypothetical protein
MLCRSAIARSPSHSADPYRVKMSSIPHVQDKGPFKTAANISFWIFRLHDVTHPKRLGPNNASQLDAWHDNHCKELQKDPQTFNHVVKRNCPQCRFDSFSPMPRDCSWLCVSKIGNRCPQHASGSEPVCFALHITLEPGVCTVRVQVHNLHQLAHVTPQHLDLCLQQLVLGFGNACFLDEILLLSFLLVPAFAGGLAILLEVCSSR